MAPFAASERDAPPHFTDAESCGDAIAEVTESERGFLPGQNLSVLSWNIQKSSRPHWWSDLQFMSSDVDLVLLQEAIPEELHMLKAEGFFASFSPGYQTSEYQSGVLTLSRIKPSFTCALFAIEPWLRTPKAASISAYPLRGSDKRLLVVNIHVVNFALGVTAFDRQIRAVGELLEAHDGPLIFAGDFNTWKSARESILTELANVWGIKRVGFEPDDRVKKFGRYLDYIYVRGLEIIDSNTGAVTSSDHNPLWVKLALP